MPLLDSLKGILQVLAFRKSATELPRSMQGLIAIIIIWIFYLALVNYLLDSLATVMTISNTVVQNKHLLFAGSVIGSITGIAAETGLLYILLKRKQRQDYTIPGITALEGTSLLFSFVMGVLLYFCKDSIATHTITPGFIVYVISLPIIFVWVMAVSISILKDIFATTKWMAFVWMIALVFVNIIVIDVLSVIVQQIGHMLGL